MSDIEQLRAEIEQLRAANAGEGFPHYGVCGEEAAQLRTELKLEKQMRLANKTAVVDAVGGIVEGNPTHTGNYLQRIREVVAEVEQLRAALHWCGEIAWQGLDIDGGSFQEHMVESNLMKKVPASDEFRAEYDADTMLAWCWHDE